MDDSKIPFIYKDIFKFYLKFTAGFTFYPIVCCFTTGCVTFLWISYGSRYICYIPYDVLVALPLALPGPVTTFDEAFVVYGIF